MTIDQYVLWIGSVFDEATLIQKPAVSPAANYWQRDLIAALVDSGEQIETLGHLPEPLWPKGQIRPCLSSQLTESCNQHLINYWNIPGLREYSLTKNYHAMLCEIVRKKGIPKYIISYNVFNYVSDLAAEAQRKWGVPWFPIIADGPGEVADYRNLLRQVKPACGRLFLSWHSYISSEDEPKLHLEGGIGRNFGLSTKMQDNGIHAAKKIIFYAGTVSRREGVDLLLDAYNEIAASDVSLWICGKTAHDGHFPAMLDNPNITYFGCVPEEKLKLLAAKASIMVNPRPNHVPDNRNNFPSKLLEYLSYGKPVVSTWTPGLSPEYRDVLIVPDEETPTSFAKAFESILSWDENQQSSYQQHLSEFIKGKTWSRQSQKLLYWIDSTNKV